MSYTGSRKAHSGGFGWAAPVLMVGMALAGGALVARILMGISAAASRAVNQKE